MNSQIKNMKICILAGGQGKRMKSELPKVCVSFKGLPMIVHVIHVSLKLNPNKIIIITGKFNDIIQQTIKPWINIDDFDKLEFVIQEKPLGTGHAVKCSLGSYDYNNSKEEVLILNGDCPNLDAELLSNFIEYKSGFNKLLISEINNPYGYGRILMNNKNEILKIVEEKDANEDERKVNKINSGIYLLRSIDLIKYMLFITNNNKSNEYYLTDIIEIMMNNCISTYGYLINKEFNNKILGINTIEQLKELENIEK